METKIINTSSPGTNLLAASTQIKPSAVSNGQPDKVVGPVQKNQEGQDRVQLSSKVASPAAKEPQSQQSPAPTSQSTSLPSTRGATAQKSSTASATPAVKSTSSSTELRQENIDAQAKQRIEDNQTIKNYTNASLYTQINGRQIDEKV